ncbi:DUF1538 domain-containing protein [Acholeplasma equirhinis]|uniref:DUF1538 domain-containing protein n=1 Tax=Acholeplasma equirhinis TaxID=555393 RepID=UPI00197A8E90|nr:DUF1538 domain-containing protein [Acholeplasma equirhinis]MBN3490415.1 DUF1538 domain-containing protein [Acholeplasma equirhinis]
MRKLLFAKIIESATAVIPMTISVALLSLLIGLDGTLIMNFLIGAVLLTLGLAIFSMGAEASMMTIASEIGNYLVQRKNLWLLVGVIFTVGLLITLAEPALWVLGDQFQAVVNPFVLISTVSIGTGIFVVIALLRIIFQFDLRTLTIIGYGLVFGVAGIVAIFNPSFIPVAFDSGGVTTGPMAVPFIMSLGYGLAKARGDKDADIDSFGLIGIASIGPIISVLVLGFFFSPVTPDLDLQSTFIDYLKSNAVSMLVAILPFILFFGIFQVTVFKFQTQKVIKVLIAFLYVYIGLVLFLTGANAGLVNLAHDMGKFFAESTFKWALIPLGMLFGYISIAAEPSVMVLNKLVEDVSAGVVTKRMMLVSLSVGVAISVGLAMVRVLTGLNIWWIILPAYIIIIFMMFFTPKIFYAIALDSGGAVSGALTSAFLMPFVFGAGVGIDPTKANILTDAFGLVAFVAMTPLITIQILGLLSKLQAHRAKDLSTKEEVISLESEENV